MNASRFLASRSVRLAFAFVLLLVASLFGTASVAHDESGAAEVVIFRSSDSSYEEIVPLDEMTLEDDLASPETGIDPAIFGTNVLFSRDGQTLVGRTADWNVVVQRGLGGPVVSRFPLGGQGWLVSLSADGSKLLASVGEYESVWKVFDTETGEETASYSFAWDRFAPLIFEIDPVNWTMYRLVRGEWNQHAVSPWLNRERQIKNGVFDPAGADQQATWTKPPALVAFDLATGAETRRLELIPDVTDAKFYDAYAAIDPRAGIVSPALALSPDGSELAIVNAADDGITLIDAKSLMVKQTLTMTPKTSLVDKLFSMLPLAPQTASAKVQAGIWREAMYSSDSLHLYVSGFEAGLDEQFVPSYKGMGLSIVNLDDGTIEAHLFDGMSIYRLHEAQNNSVFAVGDEYGPDDLPAKTVIARFDSRSYEVESMRSWDWLTTFLFVPIAET